MNPENALTDLSGKVVTITGGSRGIGKEIALAFSRCGANVVIASRKKENCTALAEHITETIGTEALPVACHVGQWDQCDELFSTVYDHFGKCDVLINNAGMSPLYKSLTDVSQDLFDKVMNVNLRGPFRLSALFGQQMFTDGNGSIINVSSMSWRNHHRMKCLTVPQSRLAFINEIIFHVRTHRMFVSTASCPVPSSQISAMHGLMPPMNH